MPNLTPDNPRNNPPESVAKPKSFIPTPEQVGFISIVGRDVLPKAHGYEGTPLERIAGMQIDNTVERRSRWEAYLSEVGLTALDPDQRKKAVTELKVEEDSIRNGANQNEGDQDLIDAIGFARSVIGNFSDPAYLRRTIQNGGRVSMQESIARAFPRLQSQYYGGSMDNLGRSVLSALRLAQEQYYQEHGEAYQTAEQKAELERAIDHAKNTQVR